MNLLLKFALIFCLPLILSSKLGGQTIDSSLVHKQWKAFWIALPNEPAKEYGVYNFRKSFAVAEKPTSFIVHVSADNRYKLFVNGKLASHGPARGDLYHWNFETVDLTPF